MLVVFTVAAAAAVVVVVVVFDGGRCVSALSMTKMSEQFSHCVRHRVARDAWVARVLRQSRTFIN